MSNKLPSITGKEAVGAFSRGGFHVVRIEGSHHIMKKPGHLHLLTIPVHGSTNVKPGTLRSLIRAAGLTIEEFLGLLKGPCP